MRRYVIIGGGVASLAAIEAIRSQDPGGEITLVSEDPHGYYSRPGLAYLLTGEVSAESLCPYKKQDFGKLRMRWISDRVERIDPHNRQVILRQSGALGYDRLLIATGSTAVMPSLPGVDLPGVVKLDNLTDARAILAFARRAKSAVVVGGGITALELVEGLVCQGTQVHYFLRGAHYWSNVLDEVESQIIESRLKEEGVILHTNTELQEIVGKGKRVEAVRTKDGRLIPAGLVAIAIGIQPRKELAVACGLKTERGILVDDTLSTSLEDIYAAGDVAQVFDPASQTYVLDSLWGPAREQGRIAGLNMAGAQVKYRKPPALNVTRLAGITTTIVGAVGRGRDADLVSITHGDSEAWRERPDALIAEASTNVNRVRILVGKTHLLGAILMGDQALSRPLHSLIARQVEISLIRDQLLAPGAAIHKLVLSLWEEWESKHAN